MVNNKVTKAQKEAGNVFTQKLPTDIYNSFIYNYQMLEGTKMPFSRWMDKLVHPDKEY